MCNLTTLGVRHIIVGPYRETPSVLIRARGTAFLPGMLRHIVGLIVAIVSGGLPEDYLDLALREDVMLNTPAAPRRQLIMEEGAYWGQFQPLTLDVTKAHASEIESFQNAWLERAIRFEGLCGAGSVEAWRRGELQGQLEALLDRRAQVIRLSSEKAKPGEARIGTPEPYKRVLQLLREADHGGRWPETSTGRQKVIEAGVGGTFTIGVFPPPLRMPLANEKFPELVRAAFELEAVLRPDRPPSSTIAINRHAQFKPHVDSGAGAGQGISLIVALGDFSGGETVVEGAINDIRYKPLEFNGWTQRHWTLPFSGERYSLVWFTPKGCEEMTGLNLVAERDARLAKGEQAPGPKQLDGEAEAEAAGTAGVVETEEEAVGRMW